MGVKGACSQDKCVCKGCSVANRERDKCTHSMYIRDNVQDNQMKCTNG